VVENRVFEILTPLKCNILRLTCRESNVVNAVCAVLACDVNKIWSNKKLKPRKSDNSPICPDDLAGVIASSFGMWGDNVDVITSAKCCVDRLSGFRVLTPPIFPFSVGLAGRPYNSVSTTVLHCEALLLKRLFHLANNYKKLSDSGNNCYDH